MATVYTSHPPPNPNLSRLQYLIETIHDIQKGDIPDDDHDDDSDERKCRFFEGQERGERGGRGDNQEDFIFFTVFRNDKCEEGDEVYSMCAQWKDLKSLVDNQTQGTEVKKMFREVFGNCAGDVGGGQSSEVWAWLTRAPKKKIVKTRYGRLVYLGNEKIYNITGSSFDKRKRNWLEAYFALGYGKCGKCYIAKEDPVCGHSKPLAGNIVGGHIWSPELKKKDKGLYFYILPICKTHNKRNVYDKPRPDGTGWMMTTSDAHAMQIKSTSDVDGWNEIVKYLTGSN